MKEMIKGKRCDEGEQRGLKGVHAVLRTQEAWPFACSSICAGERMKDFFPSQKEP